MSEPSENKQFSHLVFPRYPGATCLQVRLSVQGCGEGHVVQGPGHGVNAAVLLHPLDTVLGLVGGKFPAELLGQDVGLVGGQDPEAVDDLLGGVHVGGLPGHEVKEAVELDVAAGVGVHDGEDTLEVDLALLVLTNIVAQRYQAVLELLGIQTTRAGKIFQLKIIFQKYFNEVIFSSRTETHRDLSKWLKEARNSFSCS